MSDSKLSHAHVGFWDHIELSPLVRVEQISPDDLAMALWEVCRRVQPDTHPGASALAFCQYAGKWATTLVPVPIGDTLGQTMGRLYTPRYAPGGYGLLLIDAKSGELEVFGGDGFDDPGTQSPSMPRTRQLADLWRWLHPAERSSPAPKAKAKRTAKSS